MDGVSAAASITALIHAAAKLATYLAGVHGAKRQIDDLEKVAGHLRRTLDHCEQFLHRPDARFLLKTSQLDDLMKETKSNFDQLSNKLEYMQASSRKRILALIMFPIRLQAEIEDAIHRLSEAVNGISTALQLDMA